MRSQIVKGFTMDFVGNQISDSSNEFGSKLLTRRETAEALRISERNLDLIKKRGELPYVRVGKQRICFKSEDIDQYLQQQCERQNSPTPSEN